MAESSSHPKQKGQETLADHPGPLPHQTGTMDGTVPQDPKSTNRSTHDSSLDSSRSSVDKPTLERFLDWKEEMECKGIVLVKPSLGKEPASNLILPAAAKSRWFAIGSRRQKRNLYHSLPKMNSFGVLLTLTVDPKEFDDLTDAWQHMWVRFRAFKDNLFIRIKRTGRTAPPYVAVLEATKTGWPHAHIWFPGRHYLLPQAELQSIWGAIVDVRKASGSAARYASKYIGKLPDLPESIQAILWDSRIRIYSISPKLRSPLPKPRPSGWIYLGIVVHPQIAYSSGATTIEALTRERVQPSRVYGRTQYDRMEIEGYFFESSRGDYHADDTIKTNHQPIEITMESAVDPPQASCQLEMPGV